MVGEIKLSITRFRIQNLSLPDERSNRETSRRIGFYSVYLVSLQGLSFIQLYFNFKSVTKHRKERQRTWNHSLEHNKERQRILNLLLNTAKNDKALGIIVSNVTRNDNGL